MSENDKLDLGALVAASRDLANRAGQIVRTIYEGGDLQVIDKAYGKKRLNTQEMLKAENPTTIADILAQKLIIGSIQKHFPGLRVCGEEDDAQITDDDIVEPEMKFDMELPKQYSDILTKDCVVWVDPIDGTKEYTEGIKEAVTTLIGIAHKGRPIAGIIGRPFSGQIIWGIVGLGAFGYNPKIPLDSRDKKRRIICTTRSHFKPSMKTYISACKPTGFVRAGGSGGKVLMVIEGTADAYVFPSLGTKKWDTCGPEAILLSLGGKLTKPDGTLYDYDPDKCKPMNVEGFVATVFDLEYHDTFLENNLVMEQLDLTIFGATGFTGKLAAEYIAEQYGSKDMNYKFGLAGRNSKKLELLLNDLKKINPNSENLFKLIECNAYDRSEVENLVRLSTVIVTCVGPYSRYGENLIDACCKYGVDYVDLTGEYSWVKRMISKYEDEAIRASARLINFGGVVSAIPDIGVYTTVKYLQNKMNVKIGEDLIISPIATAPTKGAMSGGTTESWFNSMDDASKYNIDDCYFLNPDNKPYGIKQPKSTYPKFYNEFQRYSLSSIYGAIDRMVICRTNALLNFSYGKKMQINYSLMLIKSMLAAWLITFISILIKLFVKFSITRRLLKMIRPLLAQPGDGPSREDMLASRCNIYIDVETKDGKKKARTTIKMHGDLGYYLTSRILVEQGMIFLHQRKDPKRRKIKGGFLTPAVAVGDELFDRLNELNQFDITYEQLSKL